MTRNDEVLPQVLKHNPGGRGCVSSCSVASVPPSFMVFRRDPDRSLSENPYAAKAFAWSWTK